MNCPRCKTAVLRSGSLEENLQTQACQDCGGHWVQAFQYWRWLDAHGPNLPEKPAGDTDAREGRRRNC